MAAIIADFGKNKEGLNLIRLNGTQAEIFDAIDKFECLGCEIYEQPHELEKTHKHWSILVKIKIPEAQQAANE